MSISFMMVMSLIYIAVLIGITLNNHRIKQKDQFLSSVFVLGVYVFTHLGNTLWLSKLPYEKLLATHYLYFAAAQAILVVGLFWLNRSNMRVIMSITIALLAAEVLLGYAVHIDRNVTALNGALVPNSLGSAQWLLWDLRNYLSQITTLSVMLALTLPKIFQITTEDLQETYTVQTEVETYLGKFKPSKRVKRTAAFLDVSGENLCFFDGLENNEGKFEVGVLLLNDAIKQCCYEPGRTKPVGWFGRFVYWLRS